MSNVTITLTDSQVYMLVGVLETAMYQDTNEQTKAFKQRTLAKLSQELK